MPGLNSLGHKASHTTSSPSRYGREKHIPFFLLLVRSGTGVLNFSESIERQNRHSRQSGPLNGNKTCPLSDCKAFREGFSAQWFTLDSPPYRDILAFVQIPRQARDDIKKLRRTGRRLPIRARRTGERAGGFYEKNQQRGTLTASAISRLTEILRALNALMMVLIVRF